MKATIEVPDDLYRRVKAKSALEGRAVREVTIELFRRWVDDPQPRASDSRARLSERPAWFGSLREYAKNAGGDHDMESVRKSIARGRQRR